MDSTDQMGSIMNELLSRLNRQSDGNRQNSQSGKNNGQKDTGARPPINPSQALIIAGLLGGVLEVESILVDRDQTVQFILTGSLKQKAEKTEMEKLMDQIGSLPFDEVMKAIVGRLV